MCLSLGIDGKVSRCQGFARSSASKYLRTSKCNVSERFQLIVPTCFCPSIYTVNPCVCVCVVSIFVCVCVCREFLLHRLHYCMFSDHLHGHCELHVFSELIVDMFSGL